MEGAPTIKPSKGPFLWKDEAEARDAILRAILAMKVKGGKVVYGVNEVTIEVNTLAGDTIVVSGNLNGIPATASVAGKIL